MTLKKSWMRNYIIGTFLLCPPLQGMASPDDTKGESVVIGTVVNQLPALPSSIQLGSDSLPVKWDKTNKNHPVQYPIRQDGRKRRSRPKRYKNTSNCRRMDFAGEFGLPY